LKEKSARSARQEQERSSAVIAPDFIQIFGKFFLTSVGLQILGKI
jgi:hypothetical protein